MTDSTSSTAAKPKTERANQRRVKEGVVTSDKMNKTRRVEIPWLIAMQNKYGPKGFTVVGIAMDEEGKSVVAPFLDKERFDVDGQKLPMNYPILLGTDDAADKFGGILGYPSSFLISRDGKIVTKFQGLKSEDELTKAIESQL